MWLRRGARALPLTWLTILTVCIPDADQYVAPIAPGVEGGGGVGTTLRTWAWTDGWVLSLTLELDQSRWALGVFRFATSQRAPVGARPVTPYAADPYWGFTAMRRWQVLHRGSGRLYLGFGANYRSEVDFLESTRWNFAYLIAVRIDLDAHGRALEFGIHHWSDAWIRPPNRGENLLTLSFVF